MCRVKTSSTHARQIHFSICDTDSDGTEDKSSGWMAGFGGRAVFRGVFFAAFLTVFLTVFLTAFFAVFRTGWVRLAGMSTYCAGSACTRHFIRKPRGTGPCLVSPKIGRAHV